MGENLGASPEIKEQTNEILAEAEQEYARLSAEMRGKPPNSPIECDGFTCTFADATKAIEGIRLFAKANNNLLRGTPLDFAKRLGMMKTLLRIRLRGFCGASCVPIATVIAAGLILAGLILLICYVVLSAPETFVLRPIRNFIYSPMIEHVPYDLVAKKMN